MRYAHITIIHMRVMGFEHLFKFFKGGGQRGDILTIFNNRQLVSKPTHASITTDRRACG